MPDENQIEIGDLIDLGKCVYLVLNVRSINREQGIYVLYDIGTSKQFRAWLEVDCVTILNKGNPKPLFGL